MIYLQLFWEFFKVGLFAIGGGQATMPFLFDISARTGWFSAQELADMIAVSESTPGPIGVNTATYVGFTSAGLYGSLSATIGLVTPSVIIICIIAVFLSAFNEKPVVRTVMKYLRAVALGLIGYAVYQVAKIAFTGEEGISVISIAFCAIMFVFSRIFKKMHPIAFIAMGALFGILVL